MNQQNPNLRRSAPSGMNRAPGQVPRVPRDPQHRQGYPDPQGYRYPQNPSNDPNGRWNGSRNGGQYPGQYGGQYVDQYGGQYANPNVDPRANSRAGNAPRPRNGAPQNAQGSAGVRGQTSRGRGPGQAPGSYAGRDPGRYAGQSAGQSAGRTAGRTAGQRGSAPGRRNAPIPEEIQRRDRAKAEMAQTLRAKKKAEARAERKRGLHAAGRFFLYLLCAVLLIALLVGGGVLIALHHAPDAPLSTGTISFYYGGTKVRTAEAASCVDGEELYVCFNDLADYLGMKQSGSADEMKFVLRTNDSVLKSSAGDGTEESVVFYTDEHKVVINGQTELLDVPNILIGEEIWISTSFLTDWMDNLSVNYKPSQRTVKVSRILDEEKSDPDNKVTVYLPISFRLKKNDPTEHIEEDPGIGLLTESLREATAYELNFQTDLSEYEEYMNPQDNLRDAFLLLVNADHPLTASDVPKDLCDVIYTSTARNTQQLREYPARALEALFKEMHHYGYYNMAVYSGYRSYDYQATIFDQYVANEMASNPSLSREDAEALVLTYSTRPGTSEHQTGLAVDMDTMGSFTTDFAWTTEYYWLQENAWKFGFILRFPSDKTDVTSISFEPWHYRYVGRYHAKIMHDNGLCLEEYIARISY